MVMLILKIKYLRGGSNEFYNDKNNELKELFQELNNKNLSIEDLIEAIVEFIKRIEKGR